MRKATARQPIPLQPPERLHFEIGGFAGHSWEITWVEGRLAIPVARIRAMALFWNLPSRRRYSRPRASLVWILTSSLHALVLGLGMRHLYI